MKSIFVKKFSELEISEYLIYTLSKIALLERFKQYSHHDFNIFRFPPICIWRYWNKSDSIYKDIQNCISLFDGNIVWVCNEYKDGFFQILPKKVNDIIKSDGYENLENILKISHKELPDEAIKDIPLLYNHIETSFNLKDIKPLEVEPILWHPPNITEKKYNELDEDEYFAYTLSKINDFRYYKRSSHNIADVYKRPPIFRWKYKTTNNDIYEKLTKIVDSFSGNVQWTLKQMNKYYVILPQKIYELLQSDDHSDMTDLLRKEYFDLPLKAIKDIINLCDYILLKMKNFNTL